MVLIYVQKTSARLQYIAAFIFKEVLKIPYSITEYKQGFKESESIKINYSDQKIADDELLILNCGLLQETGIQKQSIDVFETTGFSAFFKSSMSQNGEFPFDIFSSTFYLISRYEEYLPHKKDKYGRYAYGNSLAFQENFLHLPLVNIWLNYFVDYLQTSFPALEPGKCKFNFIPTYDVDIAYCYWDKRFIENTGASVQSLLKFKFNDLARRIKVLSGTKKDPYDNFDWLNALHEKFRLNPLYFFLVADRNGLYDKNVLPATKLMHDLIVDSKKKYPIGLHPSWQSGDNFLLLKNEKETLEKIGSAGIEKSRQHYLRFNLPEDYRKLIDAGLTEDYSMGYGSINGFRASVASPFYWFDLENDVPTSLKIFPFCYMDSTSIFNLELSTDEAYNELVEYYSICEEVQGTFISIFHNHLLGNDNLVWRNLYEKFLNTAAGKINV